MTTSTTGTRPRACVSFGHAAVNTPDLDRFRRFYEDVLGLRLVTVNSPVDTPFRRIGAFTDRHGRQMGLLVFEVPGYSSGLPADQIGQRGRIDHLTFEAANNADFVILDRLVGAGASSGEVVRLARSTRRSSSTPTGATGTSR